MILVHVRHTIVEEYGRLHLLLNVELKPTDASVGHGDILVVFAGIYDGLPSLLLPLWGLLPRVVSAFEGFGHFG